MVEVIAPFLIGFWIVVVLVIDSGYVAGFL
jgi:hypothetical protein